MIIQLGALFSNLGSNIAGLFTSAAPATTPSFLSQLGSGITSFATETLLPAATQLGSDLLGGLAQEELNRRSRRSQKDAIKAAVRQAANAASPVVAPQQGPVFSGGAPTGSAVLPATVFPPSTVPIPQQLEINPNFLLPPPSLPVPTRTSIGAPVRLAGLGGGGGAVASTFPFNPLDFRQPVQQMVRAVSGGATAVQERSRAMPTTNGTGVFHRYTRNRENTGSQLFVCNPNPQGPGMVPIEQAPQLNIDLNGQARYRFDQLKGIFVKLKRRRLNPANTRAFMRAGRRVDAMERIARNLFSEKRKEKTSAVKRKRRAKKKR